MCHRDSAHVLQFESHSGPWRLSWCITQYEPSISLCSWQTQTHREEKAKKEKKKRNSLCSVNWANVSHFVWLPLLNWHNRVHSLAEGVSSVTREAPNIPHLSRSWLVYLGSKLCQQQYSELSWASPMSYRKTLSHGGGIHCIFYPRDGESRHALEAGGEGFQCI